MGLIESDLHRYSGIGKKALLFYAGARYMFVFRLCNLFNAKTMLKPFSALCRCVLIHLQHKYGIQIPWRTKIGKGFYIGHFGCIVVNENAIIGDNVNISHGVTIGQTNRGSKAGVPVIGSDVYLGPGAKILGNIKIGNNVAVGANAVVTNDVPDNAVVAGVPARVISMNGSEGYINWKS